MSAKPQGLRADCRLPKPSWLRVRMGAGGSFAEVNRVLAAKGLHTVCREARCPNRTECWNSGTATFLILGDICTRGCAFCAVKRASAGVPPDASEAQRIAETAQLLGLSYVVLTSVTRDDLPDRGAGIFAETIRKVREISAKKCRVEVLVPDYLGEALATVLDASPDVFAHNLEVVRRLTPALRHPAFSYERSLEVLKQAKVMHGRTWTKSSLLLGLGENEEEIVSAMTDLRACGTDILVLGQYLRPTPEHAPVVRHVPPEEFDRLAEVGRGMGFSRVHAGPLVRTSYRAAETFSGTTAEPLGT